MTCLKLHFTIALKILKVFRLNRLNIHMILLNIIYIGNSWSCSTTCSIQKLRMYPTTPRQIYPKTTPSFRYLFIN